MGNRASISLLIVALNEIEGMRKVVPEIDRELFEQIIVLDGNSTDGTPEWALEHGLEVYKQKRAGLRHGYNEVWPLLRGEWVVTFSPDGNSDPGALRYLVDSLASGADMTVASRYLPGARSEDDDVVTAFGNWAFNKIVNLLYGTQFSDVMVIFRVYRVCLPEKLGLHDDEGYSFVERPLRTTLGWEPLLSIRAAKAGLLIKEIPADEPPRIGGERKLRVFKWGLSFLLIFIRERWHMSPSALAARGSSLR